MVRDGTRWLVRDGTRWPARRSPSRSAGVDGKPWNPCDPWNQWDPCIGLDLGVRAPAASAPGAGQSARSARPNRTA
ncbi:hypothetical protein RKD18_007489 [Streptomyces phaeoluteigriseus]